MARLRVWTVVGHIGDDNRQAFTISGVYPGNVPGKRVPRGEFGWGYVVHAATRSHAAREAQRWHSAYLAGELDYEVQLLARNDPAPRTVVRSARHWWQRRRVEPVEPEVEDYGGLTFV